MSAGAGAPAVFRQNLGPACPVPTYRSLDAGTVTVQGPSFGLTQAAIRQFSPPEGNPIIGLTEYHADLSRGAIRPGSFDVTATGGSDVGAFRTSLRVGAGGEHYDSTGSWNRSESGGSHCCQVGW